MPELPEVETVVRALRATVAGETIARVHVNAPPSSIVVSDSFGRIKFDKLLKGKKILGIKRRGKNILVQLSGSVTLWVHLKMTGRFFYLERTTPVDRHDLVIFDFGSTRRKKNGMGLRFNDYRRFGRLRLFRNDELWQQEGLAGLGPEPLEITADDFVALCKSTSRMIKPALLDQSFVAGLGNIYSDESLHYARIHARKLTSSISRKKLVGLHGEIQRILNLAINEMGTSVDSYSGLDGRPGRYQKYLAVYNNEGNPCRFCGRMIVREKIGSRSTYFCPRCQKL